jgi:hypothetical protein
MRNIRKLLAISLLALTAALPLQAYGINVPLKEPVKKQAEPLKGNSKESNGQKIYYLYPPFDVKEIQPPTLTQTKNERIIEREKTIRDIHLVPPQEIRKLMIDKEQKLTIMYDQENLKYGGVKKEPLRKVNTIYYHPSLLINLTFPKEVGNVITYSPSAKVYVKGKNVIIAPPGVNDGKVFSFVVLFKDYTTANFVAERIDPLHENVLIPSAYVYYAVKNHTPEEVFLLYRELTGRCPSVGDEIVVDGVKYRFENTDNTLQGGRIRECGTTYRVVKVD